MATPQICSKTPEIFLVMGLHKETESLIIGFINCSLCIYGRLEGNSLSGFINKETLRVIELSSAILPPKHPSVDFLFVMSLLLSLALFSFYPAAARL